MKKKNEKKLDSEDELLKDNEDHISSLGISRFRADLEKGLTSEQVSTRVEQGLANVTKTGSKKTIPKIIFQNIFTVFNFVTFIIATWLISVGAYKDLFFMVIVTANIIIGIIQEIRAKLMIDKLSLISAPTTKVIRDGKTIEISVKDIVLDDIILLTPGKQISVDASVKDGVVEVNESLLTGESDSIVKKKGAMLLSGSYVVSGTCKAKVEKVGKDSYIEKLASQAKVYKKPKSDLLRSLNIIIRVILIFIVPVTYLMFNIQFDSATADITVLDAYKEAVVRTSTSVIGMIPSGLFLTTSITLAVGVIKLAKRNTLVQELYCIEMLARVDMLCLDKTGTITDGSMSVKGAREFNNTTDLSVRQIISMMQNSLNDDNMTSRALLEEFGKSKKLKATHIIPFSSSRKQSVASYDKHGTFFLGAPEFILKTQNKTVTDEINKQAKRGYRVLLLAHDKKVIKNDKDVEKLKPTALAMILIEDTIREDAIETIQYFKNSGVGVKVISGDNPLTVSMVAKRAGIENADKYISLDKVSDERIKEIADQYTVFGRVSPEQKKVLVKALKEKGKTVAMTGDGVNDILALKEADCSIAMASGSEAARNVSHLVLLDSNFSSMPKVVQEGRRVINNIERVATLFLTKTIFTIALSLIIIYANFFMSTKLAYPIELKQMNVIEFLAIGIPAFILALEYNNNRIKGSFFMNVMKNALPGALVIIFNFVMLFLLQDSLGIGTKTLSTMSLVVTTFAFLVVLKRICTPFNLLRRLLFGAMTLGFLSCITFTPIRGFLELVSLDVPQLLLVALLVVLTNTLIDFLIKLPSMLSSFIREKLRFKKIKIVLVEKDKTSKGKN